MTEQGANHPPTWDHAHFSLPELDSAIHVSQSLLSCIHAHVVRAKAAKEAILDAETSISLCFSAMLGGHPEMPKSSRDGHIVSRSEQLAEMRQQYAGALGSQGALERALRAVEKIRDPEREVTKQAGDALRRARYMLERADMSLTYANPAATRLEELTLRSGLKKKQTIHPVIGPHGFYFRAVAEATWMMHYSRDLARIVNAMKDQPKYDSKREHFKQFNLRYMSMQVWHIDCLAKLGGIVPDDHRFRSMLYVGNTLWSSGAKPGLPEHYFTMQLDLIEACLDDPFEKAAFKAIADVGRNNWHTIGMIFEENEPLRTEFSMPKLHLEDYEGPLDVVV